MINYRTLTAEEIVILESRGCSSEQWNSVFVAHEFDPKWCRNVEFSGIVKIGRLGKEQFSISGMPKRSSITDAVLHNCTLGHDCYIRNVTSGIANYEIGDSVFIENVRLIAVDCETTFANGVKVPVMNEQGGREIPMFTGLTAQIAYLLAFYRHRPLLIASLLAFIEKQVDSVRSTTGKIGSNTRIINCEQITNAHIGSHAQLVGVRRLNNATLNCSEHASIELGVGVIADSVIINGNSRIVDGAIVDTCFIGEGCDLAKHFSAEKSLFFANFIGHHGEAFGIFAGPHTATHHKSTLLISAYMSFLNAGSGSNQSNHMYKLGPLHQGVIDRGSKTSSDSYVLWPAHIGAFTLIMGRHMNHPDIRELPYSYLIENNGESLLIPGVNFKSVGTIRDADKWPTRDKRVTTSDTITYDLLTPYTIGQMKKGYDVLKKLLEGARHNERQLHYNGTVIPVSAAEKGMEYYRLGIIKYVGNILAQRLFDGEYRSIEHVREILRKQGNIGSGNWRDMAGMTAPEEFVEALLPAIESGEIDSIAAIHEQFESINSKYREYSWQWCATQIEEYLSVKIDSITVADLEKLLLQWITATKLLDGYFLEDAEKEFASRTRISFGIDGDQDVRDRDFDAVRGTVESNSFISKIHTHHASKTGIYDLVISKLRSLPAEGVL